MKRTPLCFFILILSFVVLLSSCSFVSNQFKYRETAKEFVNAILKKDYKHATELFAFEYIGFAGIHRDSFQLRLPSLHDHLVSTFGEQVECSFIGAEKEWTTPGNDSILYQLYQGKSKQATDPPVIADTTNSTIDS
jgi:hypothetical protein